MPAGDRASAARVAGDDGLSVLAIDYAPDESCYFRGEDPLLTCRGIPDLHALLIETPEPAPALADFDPYQCRLRLRMLTTAPRAEVDQSVPLRVGSGSDR